MPKKIDKNTDLPPGWVVFKDNKIKDPEGAMKPNTKVKVQNANPVFNVKKGKM